MKKTMIRVALLSLVLALGASAASAADLTHTENGVTYDITYTAVGSNITVTIHVHGTYTGNQAGTARLTGLEIKVGTDTPTNIAVSDANWTGIAGNMSGQGCNDNPNPGNVCASTSFANGISTAGPIDFTLTFTFEQSNLIPLGDIHLGAHYQYINPNNDNLTNASQVSATPTTTTVPEPGSMLLLGSGLLGLGLVSRRRRK